MESQRKKLYYIEARKLRPSKLLPRREADTTLAESVKRDGLQQPIIARPSPDESGVYEIIDGGRRRIPLAENQKVLVDVRFGLKDSDVFSISEATFQRKSRNTFERAKFFDGWVKADVSRLGRRGAQTRIAKQVGLSQGEISHYLSISDFFDKLQAQNVEERIFNALKNQSVNKLYALSKVDDKAALVEVARRMADEPDMNLQQVRSVIDDETALDRELERDLAEEAEPEEDTSRWEFQLKKATEDIAGILHQTGQTLTTLNTSVMNSPQRFRSYDMVKRIRNVLKTLRRLEKEASEIIRSGKKAMA